MVAIVADVFLSKGGFFQVLFSDNSITNSNIKSEIDSSNKFIYPEGLNLTSYTIPRLVTKT
jgi:hypothetical protein